MTISNQKIFIFFALCYIVFLLPGCNHSNRQDLKEKYSVEAINYFYETVFYEDYVGKLDICKKWNKDLYFYVNGDFSVHDADDVQSVISHLTSLDLPVNFDTASDSSSANVSVYYGSYPYLEERMGLKNREYEPFAGVGYTHKSNSEIVWAKVGIANDARKYKRVSKQDSTKLRYHILLEESVQVLGVTGDSWQYPHSSFFEGAGLSPTLSDIDKEVVKLLYEPSIPVRYSRQQFEKDFGDVLYHVNAPQKIADYVFVNNIPLHFLEYVRSHFFHDSLFVKWPSEIYISLNDNYSKEDSLYFNKAVDAFNSVSKQLRLIVGKKSPENYPSISIHYRSGTKLEGILSDSETVVGVMMFPRRLKSDIRSVAKEIDVRKLNMNIFNSLYCALGFDHNNPDDNVLEIDSLDNIVIKPDYKEMLALIYEPVFYSGLTLKEFDEALGILKAKRYNND